MTKFRKIGGSFLTCLMDTFIYIYIHCIYIHIQFCPVWDSIGTDTKYNYIMKCDSATNNIIYCIDCKHFHKQYVGHTKRTQYCSKLDKIRSIRSLFTERKYDTIKQCDCETNNIIYYIDCKRCHKQCVGHTKRTLRQRMYEHFSLFKRNDSYHSVDRHFNSIDHKGLNDVKLYVLQFSSKDPDSEESSAIRLILEPPQIEIHHPNGAQRFNYISCEVVRNSDVTSLTHFGSLIYIKPCSPVILFVLHVFLIFQLGHLSC